MVGSEGWMHPYGCMWGKAHQVARMPPERLPLPRTRRAIAANKQRSARLEDWVGGRKLCWLGPLRVKAAQAGPRHQRAHQRRAAAHHVHHAAAAGWRRWGGVGGVVRLMQGPRHGSLAEAHAYPASRTSRTASQPARQAGSHPASQPASRTCQRSREGRWSGRRAGSRRRAWRRSRRRGGPTASRCCSTPSTPPPAQAAGAGASALARARVFGCCMGPACQRSNKASMRAPSPQPLIPLTG